MKLSATFFAIALGSVAAFAPSGSKASSRLAMSEEPATEMAETVAEVTAPAPTALAINGWVPDASKSCYGLPGAIAPLGFFDPLGFTKDKELNEVKRIREAEVMHSRVAMMAVIGYLLAENTPTIAYGFTHPTIANNMVPDVPGTVLFPFFLTVNICEAWRASRGWVEPGLGPLFTLRENYYPGDLGFDPLGLKPEKAEDFANLQAKELSNGRLAMIAVAGMCVQEQVNGLPVLKALGL